MPTPVLLLDIDGTVRQGKDDALGRFVNGPEDVVVFPEAVAQMRLWKEHGGRVVGVSNQGGIALGIVKAAKVAAAMEETQRQANELFDVLRWCIHHPNADDYLMAKCSCRKPDAGAITMALQELSAQFPDETFSATLMVGDRPEDQTCARNAGVEFMWADEWRALPVPSWGE